MFHYFKGMITQFWDKTYITNDLFGLEIHYKGNQLPAIDHKSLAEVFIYPHLDDNHKTIRYFAFDTHQQKTLFENLLKISGIGPKTAFHIAQLPEKAIKQAVEQLDVKFFQNIPWIGPKSAKKILLELKDSVKMDDLQKLTIDQAIYKKITTTLKWLGYDNTKVKDMLQTYPHPITKENSSDVVKRMIQQM